MNRRLIATLCAVPVLLAGCGQASGSGSSQTAAATHQMSDGSTMSDAQMADMQGSADAPSDTASMICSDPDVQDAVRRKLGLSATPQGVDSWSASRRLFSCTYRADGADRADGAALRMSVKDLDTAGPGRAYFDGLRLRLAGARTIRGLENFGFLAFETPQGDVVFIKDHKTLHVDATGLSRADLPAGTSPADAAYGVAAAVIACWKE